MAITDNLALYYDLSEASGTRADSGPNGLTLTDNNTVTGTTGPGSHNASLFTRANSEFLSVANNAAFNVGDIDFTVACWAYLTTEVDLMTVASQTSGSGTVRAWKIYVNGTTHKFSAWVSNTGSNQVFVDGPTNSDTITTWHFVVFWHDSVANFINIQVDNGTAVQTAHSLGVFTSSGALNIGNEPGNVNYWNGALAMFGMWKRVLTSTERTFLYNSGSGMNYAEMTAPTDNIYRPDQGIILQAVTTGANW